MEEASSSLGLKTEEGMEENSSSLGLKTEEGMEGSGSENEEESSILSMEGILKATKAKTRNNLYPWLCIREMQHPINVGGDKKTHICMECLHGIVSKKKRACNDWHAALCTASNSTNGWTHLKRKHRSTTNVDLLKVFESRTNKKRKKFETPSVFGNHDKNRC